MNATLTYSQRTTRYLIYRTKAKKKYLRDDWSHWYRSFLGKLDKVNWFSWVSGPAANGDGGIFRFDLPFCCWWWCGVGQTGCEFWRSRCFPGVACPRLCWLLITRIFIMCADEWDPVRVWRTNKNSKDQVLKLKEDAECFGDEGCMSLWRRRNCWTVAFGDGRCSFDQI